MIHQVVNLKMTTPITHTSASINSHSKSFNEKQTLSENSDEYLEVTDEVDGMHQDARDFTRSYHNKLCQSESNDAYLDFIDARVENTDDIYESKSKLQEQASFDLDNAYSKLTNSSQLHKNSINFHNYEYIRSCASNEIDEELYCDIFDESVKQNISAKRVCASRNVQKQNVTSTYSLNKEVISIIVNYCTTVVAICIHTNSSIVKPLSS